MVQAFSSVGKTSLGLNIAFNNPEIPTLFLSLEMNWRMVVSRLAAMQASQSTASLELAVKLGEKPSVFQEVADKFRLLVCDDTSAITLKQASESFRAATDTMRAEPRLVIIDYLELVGGTGMLQKAEAVDKLAQQLRNWTKDHDCSTVVLHQVGKGVGGHKPMGLGDGRYGGFAPMDYVVGAYAPRLDPELPQNEQHAVQDQIWLQLLKNRAGAASAAGVKHRLDPVSMRLSEYHASVWTPSYQEQF